LRAKSDGYSFPLSLSAEKAHTFSVFFHFFEAGRRDNANVLIWGILKARKKLTVQ